MKLGLLLALTGAALVLNLSESRIVSKCELRQKLQQVLPLPRKYGRYKDQILALVTCELERRSQLDSNLVTGDAVLPTAAARQTTQSSEGNQTATEQDIDSTISSAPMISTTVPSLRRKRWASKKDFRERSDKRRGRKGQSSEENGVSGNPREKRDASSEEKGHKQRGNKRRGKKGRGSDESGKNKQKNKKEKKPSKHSHESSSQEENTMEQNQGPSKYFGLFQFSDSFFCDSGNGLSKNLCDKNCSAFVDDDITDDLECFAYRGYWRSILDEVSSSCSNQQDTYFDECE
ncbi:hypothetical protein OJAV_G00009980 [Oryzias javanicus]|uniref:lysozyme n=1 Tax=Oryzias javanicus TaxID=123683 RepID=A0A3S2MX48_ORYJA|nr:hypothetical protein OJAV_G00009980 [Oryzias javanicus]